MAGRRIPTSDALVVLVTGCSSGFGLATASALGKRGHRVIATMRDLSRSQELRSAMAGADVEILRLDVTDVETVHAAVNHIERDIGRLDAVVNNAGYGLAGFFDDIPEEELVRQFDTNFFGALRVIRASLPLLRRSEHASIINISSISGLAALPGVGAYAASKWALEGMSESLRMELVLDGISVYVVEPGVFRTKAVLGNAVVAEGQGASAGPYRQAMDRMRAMQEARISSLPSDLSPVARRVVKLIERRPKRFRWVVGRRRSPHWWTKHFLPFRLHEALVTRVLYGARNRRRGETG